MNLSADFGGFVISVAKAATHKNGEYSPDRTFRTVVLAMFIIAGAAMTAIFLYHGIKSPTTPAEYLIYAGGIAALPGGGGLGVWLHSKAQDSP